jgi:uracil phosphoribosyltransferase
VQVPQSLAAVKNRPAKRVVVIDDTVTTGSVMEHLKDYLVTKGYRRNNIKYATCVCSDDAFRNSSTRPDIYTYKVKGRYRMPWGDPL